MFKFGIIFVICFVIYFFLFQEIVDVAVTASTVKRKLSESAPTIVVNKDLIELDSVPFQARIDFGYNQSAAGATLFLGAPSYGCDPLYSLGMACSHFLYTGQWHSNALRYVKPHMLNTADHGTASRAVLGSVETPDSLTTAAGGFAPAVECSTEKTSAQAQLAVSRGVKAFQWKSRHQHNGLQKAIKDFGLQQDKRGSRLLAKRRSDLEGRQISKRRCCAGSLGQSSVQGSEASDCQRQIFTNSDKDFCRGDVTHCRICKEPSQAGRRQKSNTRDYYESVGRTEQQKHRLGKTIPFSVAIVGANTLGALDLHYISCSACGRRGHLAWECPVLFYKKFRERCPGFDEEGDRLPECWDGELCISESTRAAWRVYVARHFDEPVQARASSTGPDFESVAGQHLQWTLGATVPCAVGVVGANTKGAVDRGSVVCSECCFRGHLSWECPKKLSELFNEECPGFDSEGNRRPSCWKEGLCITTETRAAWSSYIRKHFVTSVCTMSLATDERFNAVLPVMHGRLWTLGTTIPCSVDVVGMNTQGAIDRSWSTCVACQRNGHLQWECPLQLYDMFGEACPGFNKDGERLPNCWEGGLCITEATRSLWQTYVHRLFFYPAPARPTSTDANFHAVAATPVDGEKLGITVPCAASVVGSNTLGSVERAGASCSGCGRCDGHLSWECPFLLCERFGEECPGFDTEGNRRSECWREGNFITAETRAAWRNYIDRHFEEAALAYPGSTGAYFDELVCGSAAALFCSDKGKSAVQQAESVGRRIWCDPRVRAYAASAGRK